MALHLLQSPEALTLPACHRIQVRIAPGERESGLELGGLLGVHSFTGPSGLGCFTSKPIPLLFQVAFPRVLRPHFSLNFYCCCWANGCHIYIQPVPLPGAFASKTTSPCVAHRDCDKMELGLSSCPNLLLCFSLSPPVVPPW